MTSGQDLGFTSPDSAGFNGLTFIQNLANVIFKTVPPTNTSQPDYTGMNTEATAQGKTLDSFFAQYAQNGTPIPSNFTDFMNAFRTFTGGTNPGATSGSAYTGLLQEYENFIGYPSDISATGITEPEVETQFQNAFTNFLGNYTYQSDGTVGTALNFFTEFHTFLTGTATVNSTSTSPSVATISSYEQVYNAFFPNGDFTAELQTFYQNVLKATSTTGNGSDGYFIPSQQFYNFFQQVQQQYSRSLTGASGLYGNTTVTTSATAKLQIINRIIALLIQMIDTLQGVAAAQANQLSFLTQWQAAYTNVMNQVPTFIAGNGMPGIDGTDDNSRNDRNDLNQLNSTFTENLRSDRSLISNNSKSLQSSVNQSNDAVTQQSDLVTSLLQELSTILSSIFR